MTTSLALWVVYDHPADYPASYVARRFDTDAKGSMPTESIIICPELEMLRMILAIDMGLTCLARAETDDRVIVETWV